MASAKKVPAKVVKSSETKISVADVAKEMMKEKTFRNPDPMFRNKGGSVGSVRASKSAFVSDFLAESAGVKVKGKLISPEDKRFEAARKIVGTQKWDNMNNFYKASGTKPKAMNGEQNKQFLAERAMREKAARQKRSK